jgi:hypothetical protein
MSTIKWESPLANTRENRCYHGAQLIKITIHNNWTMLCSKSLSMVRLNSLGCILHCPPRSLNLFVTWSSYLLGLQPFKNLLQHEICYFLHHQLSNCYPIWRSPFTIILHPTSVSHLPSSRTQRIARSGFFYPTWTRKSIL